MEIGRAITKLGVNIRKLRIEEIGAEDDYQVFVPNEKD